jgi:hypothetical protein
MPYNDDDQEQDDRQYRAQQHPLALHVKELTETLNALLAYPENESDLVKTHIEIIQESFYLIKAKLYSALRSDSYLVCMQNASIIRYHAEFLLVSSHSLDSLDSFDKEHVAVFRKEMEEFRTLFKAWVQEIKAMDKEDFEDEWGVF